MPPLGRSIGAARCLCRLKCCRQAKPQIRALSSSALRAHEEATQRTSLRHSLLRKKTDNDKNQPTSEPSTQAGVRGDGSSGASGLSGKRRQRNQAAFQNEESTSTEERSLAKGRMILGQSAELPIRTRFAPSPTGYLHLGSLRTALFCNLAASATPGGAFILRIEDTDQGRLVQDAEERIYSDLKWLGLSWAEGPDCGGPHGPYKQSERLDIYRTYVQQLIDSGYAYRCFCKPEDLEMQKRKLHDAGQPTVYSGTCRSVREDESSRRAAAGEPHVVRFKGDAFGRIKLRDAIYGAFQKQEVEEDFILMKTDGYPTYHLANVVDDHLMEITHVIRGEEWLISTPKHIALYQAFGWKPPTFAHLGLLVNDDGSKLSKRHDSANVSKYREKGYSPMALQPWLANLGSSFSSNKKTPRTLQDVAEALTFKFTKGGIKINLEKLNDFEGKYRRAIVHKPIPGLADKEDAIISSTIIRPMAQRFQDLTSAASPSSPWPSEHWSSTPKDPVPALAAAVASPRDNTTKNYLRSIFAACSEAHHRQTADPAALVARHPHYFWRVPLTLYKLGFATGKYDARVVDAIERVCVSRQEVWAKDRPRTDVTDALWEELGGREALGGGQVLYNAQRFVATGDAERPSQDASVMFEVLGREEWLYRVGVVKALAKEMDEGGEALRMAWLKEAAAVSSESERL